MKKFVIAIALLAVAVVAQASRVQTTATNGPHSGFPIPGCLPGQVLVPVYDANGKIIRYICGGTPTGP